MKRSIINLLTMLAIAAGTYLKLRLEQQKADQLHWQYERSLHEAVDTKSYVKLPTGW